MEEWRDIPNYEGRYQISNHGRIKTVSRHKSDGRIQAEAIRATQVDHRGYEFVLLFDGVKYHRFSVHVLVANAFLDNPGNRPQVNHIDGDKLNNMAVNLEWATASENQRHAYRTGLSKPRYGINNPSAKISDEAVAEIRSRRMCGERLRSIAESFGISQTHVSRIVRNVRRKKASEGV